jgi:hypothetical protein
MTQTFIKSESSFNVAQIENEIVVNCIIVESIDFIPNLVAIPNDVNVAIGWGYVNGVFVEPLPYVTSAEENKTTAVALLSATDWTTIADVGNPQMSNPYLENQAEFIAYRNTIRQIAVYPVAGNIDWATVPQEVWQAV